MMPPGNLWVPFISYLGALEHLDVRVLPIGRAYSAEAALKWMNRYKVNVLLGYPAEIVRVVLEARQVQGPLPSNTANRHQRHAGLRGAQAPAPGGLWQSQAGVGRLRQQRYRTSGYRCEHCTTGAFHLQDDLQILEILEIDSDQPVPKGKPGRMLSPSCCCGWCR